MRFVSPAMSPNPLFISRACVCIAVLGASASVSAQDNPEVARAPMAVVILALDDGAKLHVDALEAECQKSDKIELVDPTLLQSAMIAFTLSPLEEEPSRRALLAQVMREQGVETIITIAAGDTAKEYNIIAVGPSGEQKRQTSIRFDETSPEYNKQIENGLTSAFATVAPEVLAERKVRPKPSIPDPSTPIEPPPTNREIDRPATTSTPEKTTPARTATEIETNEERGEEPPRSFDMKNRVIFLALGPAYNIIDIGINEDARGGDGQAAATLLMPGATAHITARNPLWQKSLLDVFVNLGRGTLASANGADGTIIEQPTRALQVRARLNAMLLDTPRFELGPSLGLDIHRNRYFSEDTDITSGLPGLHARVPLSRVLLEANIAPSLGVVNWGDRNTILGYSADFGATIHLARGFILRAGVRNMYHGSDNIRSETLLVEGPLTHQTFTTAFNIGWSN